MPTRQRKTTRSEPGSSPGREPSTSHKHATAAAAASAPAPMEDKRERIIETAIELAEQGGFDAVRLRDVAARADVALGTLYKRFRSKEELLVAALELEASRLQKRLFQKPFEAADPQARVMLFFEAATRSLFRRPNLARAVIRALTSGDEEVTQRVAGFHETITSLIIAAMRGGPIGPGDEEPRATEQMVAFILQQVWFAALVGWMGGLISRQMVNDQVALTLQLLLTGVDLQKEGI